MSLFTLLSPELVELVHDEVLTPQDLQGRAADKSLEAALARVEHRLAYGMIGDVFQLAAAYAEAIARGHCFNDANKRTAFRCMHAVLWLNGVEATFETEAVADRIILLSQGRMDAEALADWLRARA